jgi:hypothetical protein
LTVVYYLAPYDSSSDVLPIPLPEIAHLRQRGIASHQEEMLRTGAILVLRQVARLRDIRPAPTTEFEHDFGCWIKPNLLQEREPQARSNHFPRIEKRIRIPIVPRILYVK